MARPGLLTILKRAGGEFVEDECPRMAAALSYYVVFSLPSLLVLVLLVAAGCGVATRRRASSPRRSTP
jgi:uncharacterized BrkB/YihY/UPF0761 family membrane protein